MTLASAVVLTSTNAHKALTTVTMGIEQCVSTMTAATPASANQDLRGMVLIVSRSVERSLERKIISH